MRNKREEKGKVEKNKESGRDVDLIFCRDIIGNPYL